MSRDIDGKAAAADLRCDVRRQAEAFRSKTGRAPGLAVILVGEDAASQVYVRAKAKAATETSIAGEVYRLPATGDEGELHALVASLNAAPDVDGILVQLPLPAHYDERAVLRAIDLTKDVDGFHPGNVGALALGEQTLIPCTPRGCLALLKREIGDLTGLHAVVIGRSNIVGKPMAALLLAEDCTVTLLHSRSRDVDRLVALGDIVVAAVGKPHFVRGEWLKLGAIVIDVGINRIEGKLVGDVDYLAARGHCGAITPVPGGVGPMTIACLLANTVAAAEAALARRN